METPDFDQIARQLHNLIAPMPRSVGEREIAEHLRQVWNAGHDAGAQHAIFVKHLKDENTAAHLALDRLHAPKTKQVPTRDGSGTEEITIGLADRIEAARRVVWSFRGAAGESLLRKYMAFIVVREGTNYLDSLDAPDHFSDAELAELRRIADA